MRRSTRFFVNAVAELLVTEEIDLLLVAGDVFHTTKP